MAEEKKAARAKKGGKDRRSPRRKKEDTEKKEEDEENPSNEGTEEKQEEAKEKPSKDSLKKDKAKQKRRDSTKKEGKRKPPMPGDNEDERNEFSTDEERPKGKEGAKRKGSAKGKGKKTDKKEDPEEPQKEGEEEQWKEEEIEIEKEKEKQKEVEEMKPPEMKEADDKKDTTGNVQDTTGNVQDTTGNVQDTTGNVQDTTGNVSITTTEQLTTETEPMTDASDASPIKSQNRPLPPLRMEPMTDASDASPIKSQNRPLPPLRMPETSMIKKPDNQRNSVIWATELPIRTPKHSESLLTTRSRMSYQSPTEDRKETMTTGLDPKTIRSLGKTLKALQNVLVDKKKKSEQLDPQDPTKQPRLGPITYKDKQTVEIKVVFLYITDIDTLSQQFEAEVYVQARWSEKQFKGLSEEELRLVEFYNCWDPQLRIMNSIGLLESEESFMLLQYESDSVYPVLTYLWHVRGLFREKLELEHFPLDVQELSIVLSSHRSMHEVELMPDYHNPSSMGPNALTTSQDWGHYQHVVFTRDISAQETKWTIKHSVLVASCHVKRKTGYYWWNIVMIILIILALSFVLLAVDPTGADRLGIIITLFLTAVAFKLVIKTTLPPISYLTYLDIYVIFALVYLALQGWEAAIMTHLAKYREKEKVLIYDEIAQSILIGLLILFHAIFLIYIQVTAMARRRDMNVKDLQFQMSRMRAKPRNPTKSKTLLVVGDSDYDDNDHLTPRGSARSIVSRSNSRTGGSVGGTGGGIGGGTSSGTGLGIGGRTGGSGGLELKRQSVVLNDQSRPSVTDRRSNAEFKRFSRV